MILVNTFVSVITLNVHRLTSQSKDIDWLSGLQNEQTNKKTGSNNTLHTKRLHLYLNNTNRLKMKEPKKIYCVNYNYKRAKVSVLLPDFNSKTILGKSILKRTVH